MAHKPPINRKLLRKEGLLSEDVFYDQLAQEVGFADPQTTKTIYLAMVRVINRRLVQKNVCRLPHLGDFALVLGKGRSALVGTRRMVLPPQHVLKFYPMEKWSKHMKAKLTHDL